MSEAVTVSQTPAGGNEVLVARNALILLVGQVAGIPLSMVFNAVLARNLGPHDFGYYYLAGTFASFGVLFADFGLGGPVPALVSKDRTRAGEYLGSGLVWRAAASVVVFAVLSSLSYFLGYGKEFQIVLALVSIISFVGTVTGALHAVVRGFERTDVAAYANVGQQLLNVAIVVPVLLMGGRLRAALLAQMAGAALVTLFVWRALRSITTSRLTFRWDTLRALLVQGSAFLFLEVALVLQPSVDAAFLSKLAPVEVVGWYAVSRKLVGVLLVPAGALTGALYPTMCRLFATDTPALYRLLSGSLRTLTVVVMPIALGCALHPDVGIRIFGRAAYGPASDNLRVLSIFVFLVYFTMTLGIFLVAAGRQRAWAAAQALCVVVSLVLNPILIPWFQVRTGNGGMGVCVASVVSEALMVGAAIRLLPRGIFDRALARGVGVSLLAGAAMAAVSRLLSGTTSLIVAPLSVIAYVACLWAMGGLKNDMTQMLRSIIVDKMKKRGR